MKRAFSLCAGLLLVGCCSGWRQSGWAQTNGGAPPQTWQIKAAGIPDAELGDLLTQLAAATQSTDGELARLRIDKWKADAANRHQAEDNAAALHRNLANAVPELIAHVRSVPASMAASFKLYRDLDAVSEALSSLAESAGAFAPAEQYSPLAAAAERLDQLRRRLAERIDTQAAAEDADLVRLRATLAAGTAATAPRTALPARIVVDDNQPTAAHRKAKPAPSKSPAQKKPSGKPSPGKPSAAKPSAAGGSAPAQPKP